MPTHTVTCDADPFRINLPELGEDYFWKLRGDIAVHFVVGGPRFGGCVNIEAGTGAEIVGIILAFDLQSS